MPLGVQLASASPHESTLIESTLEQVAVPRAGRGRPRKNPERLIYDRAADNDALRARLKQRGIELICPNRCNKRVKTQDGRPLRRYRRRWIVERFFSWLQWQRRLLVRWEYYSVNFLGFIQLACIFILLKRF